MKIDGFYLENLTQTAGAEGTGFTATLMFQGEPVAEFRDYAMGQPPIISIYDNINCDTQIIEMIAKVHREFHLAFCNSIDIEKSIEYICSMLYDGNYIETIFVRSLTEIQKKIPIKNEICLLIVFWGYGHTLSEDTSTVNGPIEKDGFAVVVLDYVAPLENPEDTAKSFIQKCIKKGDFKHCDSYILMKSSQKTPLELTIDEFMEIYRRGRAIN